MDFYVALEQLLEQTSLWQALLLLAGVQCLYFAVFAGRVRSLFDPLTYTLLLSSATTVLLVVLSWHGLVSRTKLLFSLATLALFYLAFIVVARVGERMSATVSPSRDPARIGSAALALLFFCNLVLLGATYAFFGVPLFLESRLSLFVESGGFGVIGRLTNGLEFVSLVLAFVAIRQRARSRGWGVALVLQFVVSAVLSGSKGSMLLGIFAWYLAAVYLQRSWSSSIRISRPMLLFFALALLVPLVTLRVQGQGNAVHLADLLRLLAVRVAAEGDGYVYFFVGDLIDTIARPDWLALLRPVLAGLRIVSAETAFNPGLEVIRHLFGDDVPISGPNSRLPIYILYFYGERGLVLVPLLGAALGLARTALLRATSGSALRFALLAAVYLNMTKLEVDPQITVNGLFNLALALPAFALICCVEKGLRVRCQVWQPGAGASAT